MVQVVLMASGSKRAVVARAVTCSSLIYVDIYPIILDVAFAEWLQGCFGFLLNIYMLYQRLHFCNGLESMSILLAY